MEELKDIQIIFFADETKFSINNGDPENSIYYIIIRCSKEGLTLVQDEFKMILESFELSSFHASDVFKEKKINEKLIVALSELIIQYKLDCFCFKYFRDSIYEPAKSAFSYLNDRPEINFGNQEFQAVFFLLQAFDKYLSSKPHLIQPKGIIFFDRNVYGRKDTEGFDLEKGHLIKRMVFLQKEKIDLLALPDFFGFIFRKSKLYHNKKEHDIESPMSPLVFQCHSALLKITNAGLFHFLNIESWLQEKV